MMLSNKIMGALKRLKRNEQGSTAVVMAISLPVIIGVAALMTETGYWRLEKSRLQDTADMAALAGGYQFIIANDIDKSKIAVFADASDNSFSSDSGTITINIPPASGDYAGVDAVEVLIQQEIPTFMSHLFFDDNIIANVSAVAIVGGQTSTSCVLSLAPTGTAIDVGGSVDVNLNGCGLHANSTGATAVNAFGSVNISAACASASGGIAFSGSASFDLDECSAPRENQRPIIDPYSDIDVPANIPANCSNVTETGNGNNRRTIFPNPSGNIVRFCNNDIDLRGVNTLAPGTYIFDGIDINFGNQAELHGEGVTLIFQNDAALEGLNGNNTIDLTAPTTGDYAGVVLYGDRNTMTSNNIWDLSGNANVALTGVAYLPTLRVDYGGGAGTNSTECTQVIAAVVRFRGNSGFNSNCEGAGTREISGGAYTTVQLVE